MEVLIGVLLTLNILNIFITLFLCIRLLLLIKRIDNMSDDIIDNTSDIIKHESALNRIKYKHTDQGDYNGD